VNWDFPFRSEARLPLKGGLAFSIPSRSMRGVTMKRILTLVAVLTLLFAGATQAYVIFDNFNDGNADGWWLTAPNYPNNPTTGNWRIQNQMLLEDYNSDQLKALVRDYQFSSQIIETRLSLNGDGTNGYGGVTLWYQDVNNWIDVEVYPKLALADTIGAIVVVEVVSGEARRVSPVSYNLSEYTWYLLKVVADGQTGNLDIFLDNNFLFTYDSMRPGSYSGLSGLNAGNGGGSFDDFRTTAVPIPGGFWLFGSGLVGIIGFAKLKRKRLD
jgi:hypothetical protein